jgi:type IV secretion system protein VirB11
MTTTTEQRTRAMLEEALGECLGAAMVDPRVTEICANPCGKVWIERQGEPMQMFDYLEVFERERIIRLAAAVDGVEVNARQPSLDATLPGGQRFHASIPPRVRAPYFTIRLHQQTVLTRADYVPALCPGEVFDRLLKAVIDKETVLIAGMMSSGKSTLMSTLVGAIPQHERVVTVGDVQEVRVSVPNQVALFAAPSQLHEAIEEAWRSAAHRVLVEEIRTGEAALAALNVWMGLKGGLCTVHGKGALDTLHRLEHLCMEVNRQGSFAPRIGSVVDIVVYLDQVEGKRQICEVVQVTGWKEGQYDVDTLYQWKPGAAARRPGRMGAG